MQKRGQVCIAPIRSRKTRLAFQVDRAAGGVGADLTQSELMLAAGVS